MGRPSSSPTFAHPLEGGGSEALEGVGAGAGLVDPAAENGGAAFADFAGDAFEHGAVFDGAGPGDAGGVGTADFHLGDVSPADFDDAVILLELAAGELVGLHDGDDFFYAVEGGEVVLVDEAFFADGADDGAEASRC